MAFNRFVVGSTTGADRTLVVVMNPPVVQARSGPVLTMPPDQAIELAAWLVAIAGPHAREDFERVYADVVAS
jgi:hypothetical protein